jgi:replicative DNA helicase
MPSLKPPPHSLESEEVVLASCLLDEDGSVYDDVSQILTNADFYAPRNQIIFSTLGKIVADGKPCSEISLADYLEKDGELDTVGGLEAIFAIQSKVETSGHAKYSAQIVKEKSKLRRIQRYAKLAIEGVEELQDADGIISSLDSHIVSIADTRESEFNLSECVDKALVQLTTVSDELVVPHGIASFDAEITDGGMKAGQMHTIGARPGRGKTTFALNIAGRTCVAGNGVGIISLEMSDVELIKKLICMKAQVNFAKFKDNLHSREEQGKVDAATALIKAWNLQIDDNAYMSADDILTKARIWKRKHNIKLLVIDYLQLIKGCKGDMMREQQVADMSRKIKLMAKSLQIPVIILAQLNRKCEDENRQPRLTDLRESGSIEQDSDIVTFLYNLNKDKDVDGRSNVLRWVRPKQRNGPAGCFGTFKFNGAMGVISDFH